MDESAKLFWRQSGPLMKVGGEYVKPKVLMHYCIHPGCERWGAYLYGARWKDGVPGKAYCHEHRPVEEALTSGAHHVSTTEETTDANRPDAAGDLFAEPNVGSRPE